MKDRGKMVPLSFLHFPPNSPGFTTHFTTLFTTLFTWANSGPHLASRREMRRQPGPLEHPTEHFSGFPFVKRGPRPWCRGPRRASFSTRFWAFPPYAPLRRTQNFAGDSAGGKMEACQFGVGGGLTHPCGYWIIRAVCGDMLPPGATLEWALLPSAGRVIAIGQGRSNDCAPRERFA